MPVPVISVRANRVFTGRFIRCDPRRRSSADSQGSSRKTELLKTIGPIKKEVTMQIKNPTRPWDACAGGKKTKSKARGRDPSILPPNEIRVKLQEGPFPQIAALIAAD